MIQNFNNLISNAVTDVSDNVLGPIFGGDTFGSNKENPVLSRTKTRNNTQNLFSFASEMSLTGNGMIDSSTNNMKSVLSARPDVLTLDQN